MWNPNLLFLIISERACVVASRSPRVSIPDTASRKPSGPNSGWERTKTRDWANTWAKDFLYQSTHLLASSTDAMEQRRTETWELRPPAQEWSLPLWWQKSSLTSAEIKRNLHPLSCTELPLRPAAVLWVRTDCATCGQEQLEARYNTYCTGVRFSCDYSKNFITLQRLNKLLTVFLLFMRKPVSQYMLIGLMRWEQHCKRHWTQGSKGVHLHTVKTSGLPMIGRLIMWHYH